jgi:hypothetical protein
MWFNDEIIDDFSVLNINDVKILNPSKFRKKQRKTFVKYSRHPLYNLWQAIKNRCHNPNDKSFQRYGGRGITLCKKWHNSKQFIKDVEKEIGLKPTSKHQIDRINNNEGYEPGNIRWVTPKQNSRNTRKNRLFVINGETKCLSEWAEKYNIKVDTVKKRLKRGWKPEQAFSTPIDVFSINFNKR